MAFRLVRSAGSVQDPAFVDMYASGVVNPGSVVQWAAFGATEGMGQIAPALATSTITSIIGVCLDYAQGASDKQVRVIPFVPGQIWEADCTNAVTTLHIGKRHALTDNVTLANTSYDTSTAVGIFLCYNLVGATGDKKLIGEFIKVGNTGLGIRDNVAGAY